MLKNIRFKDGRSLEEAKADQNMEKSLQKQADTIKNMEQEIKKKQEKDMKQVNNFILNFADMAKNQLKMIAKKKKEQEEKSKDSAEEDKIVESGRGPNHEVAEEALAQRASLRRKREAFINSLDPNLTDKQKQDLISDFDAKMASLAGMIQKDLLD